MTFDMCETRDASGLLGGCVGGVGWAVRKNNMMGNEGALIKGGKKQTCMKIG